MTVSSRLRSLLSSSRSPAGPEPEDALTAQDRYGELLAAVSPTMKAAGYKKLRKDAWRKQAGENYTVINFQRSKHSTSEEVKFTINLGVKSKLLHDFNDEALEGVMQYPPRGDYDCEWRLRVGSLLPERRDKWWPMKANKDICSLASEVDRVLGERALPGLESRATDGALIELGQTPVPTALSLLDLAVLLRTYGPVERFEALLRRLKEEAAKNSPRQEHLLAHIERLEQNG